MGIEEAYMGKIYITKRFIRFTLGFGARSVGALVFSHFSDGIGTAIVNGSSAKKGTLSA